MGARPAFATANAALIGPAGGTLTNPPDADLEGFVPVEQDYRAPPSDLVRTLDDGRLSNRGCHCGLNNADQPGDCDGRDHQFHQPPNGGVLCPTRAVCLRVGLLCLVGGQAAGKPGAVQFTL